MPPPRKDQFSGCLIGQCLGDALGFPMEGHPPQTCRKYVDEFLKTHRAGEMGRGSFPFGQYTDDSQLARELLQSYVAQKRFDPKDYAGRISAIFAEGRVVGRGRATEEAAWRLARGVSWEEAGTPSPSAGNGSAMRAGPIGLIFYDDPEMLIQSAHDQGRITHKDPRCSAGAVAIAGAVSLALPGGEIRAKKFLAQLSEWAKGIDASVAEALQQLAGWVDLPVDEAAPSISRAGSPDFTDAWQGISPFVTGSVLWSLYSFLRSPGDYWETVCTAIAVGGDVDTTAAMAGAISGAYLGLGAVPEGLTRHLTDQGSWGISQLVELAEQAYEIKTAGP
ncbi:MAG: ADP-ribosylglycohydrolase family protein [Nitrospinota bacterium]